MTSTRVNEIDLLRFVAALAVVFFHYAFRGYAADSMSVMPYPLLASVSKYGYLGVELFFMISGFVILMTAANGSLRDFCISRVVRLYPAYWTCCTLTFLVILAIGKPQFTATMGQYLANMTMLSGFVGVPSIDGVYWSLFVELRFYALIAIVLFFGRIHQAQVLLAFWLIISIVLEVVQIGKLRYLLITDYSPYFIAGATFFLIWQKGLSPTRLLIITISWLFALYQSINGLQGFVKHYDTPINVYIVFGIITSFFVVMMFVSLRRTGFIRHRHWFLFGVLTYPMYLLHQRIGYMVFNATYPAINAHILFWGTLTAVLISAYLVHILIERRVSLPMRRVLNNIADLTKRKVR
ncbi:MAG TPA: acyltransferase [Burkholderiaceae bacterium]|nr:acyltransferase [Burkholderiaceae bacterium]